MMQSMAQRSPISQAAGHEIPAPLPSPHPNVIWVLGDQFRAQALGSQGDPNAKTPNLDGAAATGVSFVNQISGFPLCCPFRGSLLTSRYPNECVPGHEYALPKGMPTIATVFNSKGYKTAYFGKWHLGGWHESDGRAAFFITDPDRRGDFQEWTGYENNNSQDDCWVHGGRGKDAFHYRLPGYETDSLTNLMLGYIRDRGEDQKKGAAKPFFAVLSVQPPHDPYFAPPQYMADYNPERIVLRANVAHDPVIEEQARRELAGYYAEIENLDWNYGRILQALRDNDLITNTHVLFFADHGDMHGSHGMFRKTNPYDEAIRIPMIYSGGVAMYEGLKEGRVPVLSNHVDIAPTTLGLCGIAKPDWMHGTDYSRWRISKPDAGPMPDADSAYLQNVIPTGHPDSINKAYRGLVTRDGWKYVCFENCSWLMFNLNEDPYEQANLAFNNRYQKERKRLITRLGQWVSDTGDTFHLPDS